MLVCVMSASDLKIFPTFNRVTTFYVFFRNIKKQFQQGKQEVTLAMNLLLEEQGHKDESEKENHRHECFDMFY